MDEFQALVAERSEERTSVTIRKMARADLPEGDVTVQVAWSGINYKDALAVLDRGKIIRTYPMVPGIDLAGTVIESASPEYVPGDEVLVTGFGSGEDHWGGYTQLTRLRSEWLLPMPTGLSARHAMVMGTAGFTAMLAVSALEDHAVTPDGGEVIVTGAGGGVGSFAVRLLSSLGYRVIASTGRPDLSDYLADLGAASILPRAELSIASDRPIAGERWAGAIDTVGGPILASLIRSTQRHGSIAACGNVTGFELHTSVLPFILRGVNLLGVDSNYCPSARRRLAWRRLAELVSSEALERIVQDTVGLSGVPAACESVLAGRVRGRELVRLLD